jgi:ATP/maltotriose-dependent transcriptional regulator MalT
MRGEVAELLEQADRSLAAGDLDRARRAATEALAIDGSPEAESLLGAVAYIADESSDALAHWERAFRGLRDQGDLGGAARVATLLGRLSASTFGRESAAQGWSERARMLLDRVGPCVERGYLELAVLGCDRTDIDELLAAADRALSIAIEFGDSDLEALAMADSGLALVCRGRIVEGFGRLDAALTAVAAGEVGFRVAGQCFCSMLTACDRAGDLRRAEEWTAVAEGVLDQLEGQPRPLYVHCRMAYGSVLCATGRWQEAEAQMLDALGTTDAPNEVHRAQTSAHLATLRIEQGRLEEAAELLEPYEDWITTCAPLARVHLRRGDADRAAALLRRGLTELVGDHLRSVSLLALLVEAELARGDLDAARAAADEAVALAVVSDLPSLRGDAALADARVLVALGDVRAALDSFQVAKGRFADADRPFQLGLCRLEVAEVLVANADRAGAVTEARAALATFDRLGASTARDRTSAVLRSLGDSGRTRPPPAEEIEASLTPREIEVLGLVRAGLTNAEIADRLFISPKTAEHHVGRILTKLGVRSRGEAAATAVRLGL